MPLPGFEMQLPLGAGLAVPGEGGAPAPAGGLCGGQAGDRVGGDLWCGHRQFPDLGFGILGDPIGAVRDIGMALCDQLGAKDVGVI